MSDLQIQSKHSVEVDDDSTASANTFAYHAHRTTLSSTNSTTAPHTPIAVEEEVTMGEKKSQEYVFDIPNKGQFLTGAVLEIDGHGFGVNNGATISQNIERVQLLQHANRNVLLERLDNADLAPTPLSTINNYDIMDNSVAGVAYFPLTFLFTEEGRALALGNSTFSICVKFYDNSKVSNATLSLRTTHVYTPFGEFKTIDGKNTPTFNQSKIPFDARTTLYYALEGHTNDDRNYMIDLGDLGSHLKHFNIMGATLTPESILTLSSNKNGSNPIVRQTYKYFTLQSAMLGHATPGFHFDTVRRFVRLATTKIIEGGSIDLSQQNLYLHITNLDSSEANKTLILNVTHEECLHRDSYGMFYTSQNFLTDGISITDPMSLAPR